MKGSSLFSNVEAQAYLIFSFKTDIKMFITGLCIYGKLEVTEMCRMHAEYIIIYATSKIEYLLSCITDETNLYSGSIKT